MVTFCASLNIFRIINSFCSGSYVQHYETSRSNSVEKKNIVDFWL